MGLFAIKQVVDAGNDFDGVAPESDPSDENGVRTYEYDTSAGLFEFPVATQGYDIQGVQIKFGGQSTWSLSIVDGTVEITWLSGTTDTEEVWADVPVTIPPGATLKLVTTGASTAMQATVFFSPSQLGQS